MAYGSMRDRRLAISEEALRDHDVEWLTERLLEDVPEQEFRFHTNRATSEEECHKILAEMRISHLIPVNRRWISKPALRRAPLTGTVRSRRSPDQ